MGYVLVPGALLPATKPHVVIRYVAHGRRDREAEEPQSMAQFTQQCRKALSRRENVCGEAHACLVGLGQKACMAAKGKKQEHENTTLSHALNSFLSPNTCLTTCPRSDSLPQVNGVYMLLSHTSYKEKE